MAILETSVNYDFMREAHAVRESDAPDMVSAGVATSLQHKKLRQKLVGERYLTEGYIHDDQLIDGAYVDHHELTAIPFVALREGNVVGSLRLIQNSKDVPLPINKLHQEKHILTPSGAEIASMSQYEMSQLAKPVNEKSMQATLALYRSYVAYARDAKIPFCVAVIDANVIKMLNSSLLGFGIEQIGENIDYMGSISTPVLIDHEKIIENSKNRSRVEHLAEFLDKGKASGFEWYNGK